MNQVKQPGQLANISTQEKGDELPDLPERKSFSPKESRLQDQIDAIMAVLNSEDPDIIKNFGADDKLKLQIKLEELMPELWRERTIGAVIDEFSFKNMPHGSDQLKHAKMVEYLYGEDQNFASGAKIVLLRSGLNKLGLGTEMSAPIIDDLTNNIDLLIVKKTDKDGNESCEFNSKYFESVLAEHYNISQNNTEIPTQQNLTGNGQDSELTINQNYVYKVYFSGDSNLKEHLNIFTKDGKVNVSQFGADGKPIPPPKVLENGKPISIGRGPANNINLVGGTISTIHSEVLVGNDGKIKITNLGHAGTYIVPEKKAASEQANSKLPDWQKAGEKISKELEELLPPPKSKEYTVSDLGMTKATRQVFSIPTLDGRTIPIELPVRSADIASLKQDINDKMQTLQKEDSYFGQFNQVSIDIEHRDGLIISAEIKLSNPQNRDNVAFSSKTEEVKFPIDPLQIGSKLEEGGFGYINTANLPVIIRVNDQEYNLEIDENQKLWISKLGEIRPLKEISLGDIQKEYLVGDGGADFKLCRASDGNIIIINSESEGAISVESQEKSKSIAVEVLDGVRGERLQGPILFSCSNLGGIEFKIDSKTYDQIASNPVSFLDAFKKYVANYHINHATGDAHYYRRPDRFPDLLQHLDNLNLNGISQGEDSSVSMKMFGSFLDPQHKGFELRGKLDIENVKIDSEIQKGETKCISNNLIPVVMKLGDLSVLVEKKENGDVKLSNTNDGSQIYVDSLKKNGEVKIFMFRDGPKPMQEIKLSHNQRGLMIQNSKCTNPITFEAAQNS